MIIPPGFIACFVRYTLGNGHQCQNVMGYGVAAPPDQTDADDFSTAIGEPLTDILSTSATYTGTRILIGQDGDPLELESTAGTGAGGRGGAEAPPNVEHLIVKKTASAGRKNRGRLFVPCVQEDQVDNNGLLNSTAISLVSTYAQALQGPGVSGWQAVILHSGSDDPTPISDMFCESMVATLRNRLVR